jgi:arylsulfatase A-like enzyme
MTAPETTRRPNVVLFCSDQQRADTMPGVRAARDIHTPHLTWLAQRGTLFRNAFCVTPMCSPARASLLSGYYPHTTGMVSNHQERPISDEMHLSPDVRVLADYLKPAGYACAYTGKWHLGTGADRRGFTDFTTHSGDYDVDTADQNEILRFTQATGIPIGGKALGYDHDPADYDSRTQVGASLLPLAWHPSTQDASRAAGYIRGRAGKTDPFCLVYSCHEPHPPFVSPRPFDRMYADRRDEMPLPASRRNEDGPRLLRQRADWQLKHAAGLSDDDLRAMWAAYYGAVSYVDHLVGLLLAALVETDQLKDTLFVYTSDHGEMLGAHSLTHKGAVLYDDLTNIPLLVTPPGGLNRPHQTRRVVSHVDLAPTVLEWCGVSPPADLHGANLRPLITAERDAPVHQDGAVALEYHSSNWGERPAPLRGWRTEEWKYVATVGGDDELYRLTDDPLEQRNLIDDPAAAADLRRARAQLSAWMARTGDDWPNVPVPDREVPKPAGGPWASYR